MTQDQIRATRLLRLFTALPVIMVAAFFTASHVPDRWRNLFFLAVFGAVLSIVFTVPIREALRLERREGLVPRRPGLSGKLELVAEVLRHHARKIEEETYTGFPSSFAAYVAEVRRLTLSQEQREIFSGLTLDFDESRAAQHTDKLRRAAEEAERYAQEVRARGGIFRLSLYERTLGVVLVIAGFVWGWAIAIRHWDAPSWSFFGGVALIVSSVVVAIGLLKSQREAA